MMAISNILVIKRYFEKEPYGREITTAEFKPLTPDDRTELARLAAVELGLKEVAPGQYE